MANLYCFLTIIRKPSRTARGHCYQLLETRSGRSTRHGSVFLSLQPWYTYSFLPSYTHIIYCVVPSVISRLAVRDRSNRVLGYKPPLHADEMGLTSDKYIPLNSTISSLPLTITYSPMSLQVSRTTCIYFVIMNHHVALVANGSY